jgi:hypothetical protein
LQRQLEAAKQRIEELEKKSGGSSPPATAKVDASFSMRAEYSGPRKLDHQLSYCGGPAKG